MAVARNITVSTHGRYLVESPTQSMPSGVLVGCHGYGESADLQMQRLRAIPNADRWVLVSIQGLHRFYRGRTEEVVASWMTRQDRELAIADNIAFVSSVIDEIARESQVEWPFVYAGFSQGVAMAFRAACSSKREVAGIVAVGAGVPPELSADLLARLPVAFLARGARDDWYTLEKWNADQLRLRAVGVHVHAIGFEGGHEWHEDVNREVGALLERVKL